VKRAKGDLDGATADFNKAIEIDPRHAAAYNSRGVATQAHDDLDGAISDYEKASEIDKAEPRTLTPEEWKRVVERVQEYLNTIRALRGAGTHTNDEAGKET